MFLFLVRKGAAALDFFLMQQPHLHVKKHDNQMEIKYKVIVNREKVWCWLRQRIQTVPRSGTHHLFAIHVYLLRSILRRPVRASQSGSCIWRPDCV